MTGRMFLNSGSTSDPAWLDIKLGRCGCAMEKVSHGVGQCFAAQKVGAVREDSMSLVLVTSIDVGSQQGEFIVQAVDVVFKAVAFHQLAKQ